MKLAPKEVIIGNIFLFKIIKPVKAPENENMVAKGKRRGIRVNPSMKTVKSIRIVGPKEIKNKIVLLESNLLKTRTSIK